MRVIVAGTKKGDVQTRRINNELSDLQELVGGYIETCAPVELREEGIELLANEEGLLAHLEPNENLYPFFFVGTLVFVAVDGEEFTGLSMAQCRFIREWLEA